MESVYVYTTFKKVRLAINVSHLFACIFRPDCTVNELSSRKAVYAKTLAFAANDDTKGSLSRMVDFLDNPESVYKDEDHSEGEDDDSLAIFDSE